MIIEKPGQEGALTASYKPSLIFSEAQVLPRGPNFTTQLKRRRKSPYKPRNASNQKTES